MIPQARAVVNNFLKDVEMFFERWWEVACTAALHAFHTLRPYREKVCTAVPKGGLHGRIPYFSIFAAVSEVGMHGRIPHFSLIAAVPKGGSHGRIPHFSPLCGRIGRRKTRPHSSLSPLCGRIRSKEHTSQLQSLL